MTLLNEFQGSCSLFSYNTNNGLMSSMTYPNGVQCAYQYDVMDRITGITWTGPQTNVLRSFEYGFSPADLITNVVFESGEQAEYTYDSLDRLTGESRVNPQGETMWDSAYMYDLAGNRQTKTRDGATVTYSYGSGDRLTNWIASSTGTLKGVVDVFGYSSETNGTNPQWGQRTVNDKTAQVSGTNFWVHELAVNAGSSQQIVAAIGDVAGNVGRTTNGITMSVVTNAGYQYDSAGNVTNIAYAGYKTLHLQWDGQYRLLTVATNSTAIESNRYDAFGRRISAQTGTNLTYFVYDGLHIVAEVSTNGSLVRSYTYGPGIDNILAMTAYSSTTSTYYYLKDHLGSVVALTDTNGVIVESYRYDAWGRVSVFDAGGRPLTESAVGNRFLFQGREYSWNTGLYYFRARWYDPITGRWLSNDPIDVLGGLNQYVFVGNNPVNYLDPFGLDGSNACGSTQNACQNASITGITLNVTGSANGSAILSVNTNYQVVGNVCNIQYSFWTCTQQGNANAAATRTRTRPGVRHCGWQAPGGWVSTGGTNWWLFTLGIDPHGCLICDARITGVITLPNGQLGTGTWYAASQVTAFIDGDGLLVVQTPTPAPGHANRQ
jgi:RHS repeat-associated protein